MSVIIVGSSVSGLLAAAVLRLRRPELEITMVGPATEKRPVVGESLVEPAMLLLVELGLEPWLQQHCAVKNGLSFYHKLAPDQPKDRRYSLHAPEALHYLSRQLNRPLFDAKLREQVLDSGVEWIEDRVARVEVGHRDHRVHLAGGRTLRAPWLIDASGRSRIVGKRVARYERPPRQEQRSSLWFRLVDFEPFLPRLQLSSRRPLAYELYDSTHHFMGRGYWVWGIPLKDPDHERMISLGMTWRPDQLAESPRTVEDVVAILEGEHPVVAETIRSGVVLDAHTYRSYLYRAQQVYSEAGWFLIGDAARAVDPLYSTGLSMTAIQAEQIVHLIGAPQDAAVLSEGFGAIADARQRDITHQYTTMHDPVGACLRRYWNLCGWFNGILPLWFNGYLQQPAPVAWLTRQLQGAAAANEAAWRLFGEVSAAIGEPSQADFDRLVDFDWLLNPAFDCEPDEVPLHLRRMLRKRAWTRWHLARLVGWRSLAGQLRWIGRELIGSVLVPRLLPREGVQRALTFPDTRPRLSCLGDPARHPARRIAARG
ncbi:MAG TPA: hypothetical protein ENK18_09175 [Deltaproteobacteria bacterium]|nr:hypothetical protein [Deltaproteobacteria bacterium]